MNTLRSTCQCYQKLSLKIISAVFSFTECVQIKKLYLVKYCAFLYLFSSYLKNIMLLLKIQQTKSNKKILAIFRLLVKGTVMQVMQ